MKDYLELIFILIVLFAIWALFGSGIHRAERAECLSWQKQDQQYYSVPDYGNPQWAKDQCSRYSIPLK